jgi:recombinational DNA repair ATPase RecF
MRPLRLELKGFTSFKEPTVVDFDDAGYFALVGPTGSGKSSLIDAICFALYGSVPRYDDKRLKGAVITQGHLEARARLDFALGPDTYTAVGGGGGAGFASITSPNAWSCHRASSVVSCTTTPLGVRSCSSIFSTSASTRR